LVLEHQKGTLQMLLSDNSKSGNTDLKNLSLEDKQKLVSVFAWLIEEDKKQNSALYQSKKVSHD
jgi:hypothetical protein